VVDAPRAAAYEQAGAAQRAGQLGEAVLDRLEGPDRHTELMPLAHVPDAEIERGLRQPDEHGRHQQLPLVHRAVVQRGDAVTRREQDSDIDVPIGERQARAVRHRDARRWCSFEDEVVGAPGDERRRDGAGRDELRLAPERTQGQRDRRTAVEDRVERVGRSSALEQPRRHEVLGKRYRCQVPPGDLRNQRGLEEACPAAADGDPDRHLGGARLHQSRPQRGREAQWLAVAHDCHRALASEEHLERALDRALVLGELEPHGGAAA
jgi:hypothetical protein